MEPLTRTDPGGRSPFTCLRAEGLAEGPLPRLLYESERKFSAYFYYRGHGPLEIVSGAGREHSTNVTLRFQDVRVMELRAWTEGIRVEEIDLEEIRDRPSAPADLYEHGMVAYRIGSLGWEGYLVAGAFMVREDETPIRLPKLDPSEVD